MNIMRLGLFLLTALFSLPVFGANQAELGTIKKVYLLPMGSGLDQYLANQLTMNGVFLVVTDPEQADAIFTDQIGMKFEQQLEELYPPPPPPEEEEPEPEEDEEAVSENDEPGEMIAEPPPPRASFARGKGNVFLVKRDTKAVVWSIYQRPKDYSSKQLNKTAQEIIATLQAAIYGSK
jgi:hypothetical protein